MPSVSKPVSLNLFTRIRPTLRRRLFILRGVCSFLFASYSYCGHSFHIVSLFSLFKVVVFFCKYQKGFVYFQEITLCTEPPLETELLVWRLLSIFLCFGGEGSGKHVILVNNQISFENLYETIWKENRIVKAQEWKPEVLIPLVAPSHWLVLDRSYHLLIHLCFNLLKYG